ncbi:TrbC/VirB2 family protein [Alterisphingorhabdus coralli]|uniref:TrbC/VirB2 family protein n=1 Tax=Alterisphingorhabdus coralli TaxID=3071408 RepID=A0AA97FA54_9SPHN|nr:TrbC/VirB2 family protein [Parasphingorhabdus sp. SCSIO 66989]WOE76741.1 TrbC/VirB2 family protein [Parasphingorhabdus sp. SCSIO 66989]
MMLRHKIGIWGSVALLLAPVAAVANPPEAVARAISDYLVAGTAIFVTLAIVYLGYMFMLNRQAGQIAVSVGIGVVAIALSAAIVAAAAQPSATSVATVILGELRNIARFVLVLMLIISGIRYWFDGSSASLLVPIIFGWVIIETAAYFAGQI